MTEYTLFDPLFLEDEADGVKKLAEAFGAHGMYSEEGLNRGIGESKPQRYDAVLNYMAAHAHVPDAERDYRLIASRTNYFRETYAYGDEIYAPGIEPFVHHEGMIEVAKAIHGRAVIEPAIVFANLFLPGQELACHTDVPEFRGANRKVLPQWLLVVMKHSGLFEDWRMPIATCVSWYHDADGGAFVFYPDGADGEAVVHEIKANTAVIIDTDSVFHGVGRMQERGRPLPVLKRSMKIVPEGKGQWRLTDGDIKMESYDWQDMRLSVSWKAYCFRDETEQRMWRDKSDDLALPFILETLAKDLRDRGALGAEEPSADDLMHALISTYIHFPPPHPVLVPDAFKTVA